MNMSDWLTILAIVIAPLLAVQIQRWLDILRERRNRKQYVFQTLMATRAARVSPDHVRALNMIDIEFYGKKVFGIRCQSKTEKKVTEQWKLYLDNLTQQFDDTTFATWSERNNELFNDLLYEMSICVGYAFDKVQLKRNIYSPRAHGDLEGVQKEIRDNLNEILQNKRAINVRIESK